MDWFEGLRRVVGGCGNVNSRGLHRPLRTRTGEMRRSGSEGRLRIPWQPL